MRSSRSRSPASRTPRSPRSRAGARTPRSSGRRTPLGSPRAISAARQRSMKAAAAEEIKSGDQVAALSPSRPQVSAEDVSKPNEAAVIAGDASLRRVWAAVKQFRGDKQDLEAAKNSDTMMRLAGKHDQPIVPEKACKPYVALRVRPLTTDEKDRNAKRIISLNKEATNGKTVTLKHPRKIGMEKSFTFDCCLFPSQPVVSSGGGTRRPQASPAHGRTKKSPGVSASGSKRSASKRTKTTPRGRTSRTPGSRRKAGAHPKRDQAASNKAPPLDEQQELFNHAGIFALKNIWRGRNVTLVSVGTLRGGKSYSMVGKRGSEGLLQRICAHLFRMIAGDKPEAVQKPLTPSSAQKAGKPRRSRTPTSSRRTKGRASSGSRARRGAKRSPASQKKVASLEDLRQRFLDSFGASAGGALYEKVKTDPGQYIKDERPLVRRVAKQLGVSQASKNAASASGAAAAAAAAAAAGGTEKKDDQAEASPPEEFIVKVSIVELSEGRILDNLDPSKASTELHVRRNELTNGLFEGVTQVTIKSYSDFETLLEEAQRIRAVNCFAEDRNERTHFVVNVEITRYHKPKENTVPEAINTATLRVVDLSGEFVTTANFGHGKLISGGGGLDGDGSDASEATAAMKNAAPFSKSSPPIGHQQKAADVDRLLGDVLTHHRRLRQKARIDSSSRVGDVDQEDDAEALEIREFPPLHAVLQHAFVGNTQVIIVGGTSASSFHYDVNLRLMQIMEVLRRSVTTYPVVNRAVARSDTTSSTNGKMLAVTALGATPDEVKMLTQRRMQVFADTRVKRNEVLNNGSVPIMRAHGFWNFLLATSASPQAQKSATKSIISSILKLSTDLGMDSTSSSWQNLPAFLVALTDDQYMSGSLIFPLLEGDTSFGCATKLDDMNIAENLDASRWHIRFRGKDILPYHCMFTKTGKELSLESFPHAQVYVAGEPTNAHEKVTFGHGMTVTIGSSNTFLVVDPASELKRIAEAKKQKEESQGQDSREPSARGIRARGGQRRARSSSPARRKRGAGASKGRSASPGSRKGATPRGLFSALYSTISQATGRSSNKNGSIFDVTHSDFLDGRKDYALALANKQHRWMQTLFGVSATKEVVASTDDATAVGAVLSQNPSPKRRNFIGPLLARQKVLQARVFSRFRSYLKSTWQEKRIMASIRMADEANEIALAMGTRAAFQCLMIAPITTPRELTVRSIVRGDTAEPWIMAVHSEVEEGCQRLFECPASRFQLVLESLRQGLERKFKDSAAVKEHRRSVSRAYSVDAGSSGSGDLSALASLATATARDASNGDRSEDEKEKEVPSDIKTKREKADELFFSCLQVVEPAEVWIRNHSSNKTLTAELSSVKARATALATSVNEVSAQKSANEMRTDQELAGLREKLERKSLQVQRRTKDLEAKEKAMAQMKEAMAKDALEKRELSVRMANAEAAREKESLLSQMDEQRARYAALEESKGELRSRLERTIDLLQHYKDALKDSEGRIKDYVDELRLVKESVHKASSSESGGELDHLSKKVDSLLEQYALQISARATAAEDDDGSVTFSAKTSGSNKSSQKETVEEEGEQGEDDNEEEKRESARRESKGIAALKKLVDVEELEAFEDLGVADSIPPHFPSYLTVSGLREHVATIKESLSVVEECVAESKPLEDKSELKKMVEMLKESQEYITHMEREKARYETRVAKRIRNLDSRASGIMSKVKDLEGTRAELKHEVADMRRERRALSERLDEAVTHRERLKLELEEVKSKLAASEKHNREKEYLVDHLMLSLDRAEKAKFAPSSSQPPLPVAGSTSSPSSSSPSSSLSVSHHKHTGHRRQSPQSQRKAIALSGSSGWHARKQSPGGDRTGMRAAEEEFVASLMAKVRQLEEENRGLRIAVGSRKDREGAIQEFGLILECVKSLKDGIEEKG